VRGIELEIIAISDEPIPGWEETLKVAPGAIGEIAVKGAQVTSGYHNRPASTALAKIADPRGGFWHRMGDLGYRDEKGRVWFCGRKSHRVQSSAGDFFTIPCEGIFNTHPAVYRTALVGIGPVGSQRPVLCVELEKGRAPAQQGVIRSELLKLGQEHEQTQSIEIILFHPAFPVDIRHNAKIFREKLALWAATQVTP
jgi:acyl-CoA synthetase (AMP-forming)/AMP-acid ligase II